MSNLVNCLGRHFPDLGLFRGILIEHVLTGATTIISNLNNLASILMEQDLLDKNLNSILNAAWHLGSMAQKIGRNLTCPGMTTKGQF